MKITELIKIVLVLCMLSLGCMISTYAQVLIPGESAESTSDWLDMIYATAGYSVYTSDDKGITWTDLDPNISLPALFINCLVYDENSNEGLYARYGICIDDLQITGTYDISWTGAINTDWNNGGNWSGGFVPQNLNNVSIPDVANDPVISLPAGTPAWCNTITVEPGATLTINPGSTLITNDTP